MSTVRIRCPTLQNGLQRWIEPGGATTAGSLLASIRRDVPDAAELLYLGRVLPPETDLSSLSPTDDQLYVHVALQARPFVVTGIPSADEVEASQIARDSFHMASVRPAIIKHIRSPFRDSGLPDAVILRLSQKCVAQAEGNEEGAIALYDQVIARLVHPMSSD
jgi:hypothetical protein